MTMQNEAHNRISELIKTQDVVLFMKGTPVMPQCGFSATVVQILDSMTEGYQTVDVLADPEVREGIKSFSNWPTIPQLYVKGEFIGGCDIIKDMFASGDLHTKLGLIYEAPKAPSITVTDSAKTALEAAMSDSGAAGQMLHLAITPSFQTQLQFGPDDGNKLRAESNGVAILTDSDSAKRAEGLVLDFIEGPDASGFKIDNPNAPKTVEQMKVPDVKAWLDDGKEFVLIDVRGEDERETAKIEGARMLDDALQEELSNLDRETLLVFHCHHGGRSQRAAEHFSEQGFRNVYNMAGGIDAWSQEIDNSIARY
jgi:monothiol glutaredoxin